MAKLNLTTTLHVKIVLVVVLLLITVTTYNHLLYWYVEDDKSIQRLMAITDYLAEKKPPRIFSESSVKPNVRNGLTQDCILDLNKELQPLLDNMFMPVDTVKFGFYSLKHESIVAIGPNCDTSMLIPLDPAQFNAIYASNTGQLIEMKNSLLWPGSNTITYINPLREHGIVVGHVFACRNQDAIISTVWKRTVDSFLATFLMLIICIAIFRGLFIKLKEHLHLFAKSILTGQSYNYTCEIAELNPILSYIREQTQEMIHLDRLNVIGEMAAGIAHEIRNPMTTVRGFLQFMNNKKKFITHKKNFVLMINELDRANSIITEFLSLAQNNSMVFLEQNLNMVIQEIHPLLEADALSKNCRIKLTLHTIPNICIDPNSIRQLLLNMVRNGLDAMPTGGAINITTKATDTKILLSISDSGIGIPLKIREKLGTPFFTTKEDGTGLGLAICYRIVQRHSGIITVESEPGNGTTFTIEFNHM